LLSRSSADFIINIVGFSFWQAQPIKEAGMQDYRLDAFERPERHPTAVDRLTGRRPSASVDYSGGELPGRKVDGRR
jgi:hypothetical protein